MRPDASAAFALGVTRRFSGQPVDEYVAERVFEPLGMTQSSIGRDADEDYDVANSSRQGLFLSMGNGDSPQSVLDSPYRDQLVQCAACESALQSPGRESVSFLLLDQLTIPLVGYDNHLEEFCSLCGLATEGRAELLDHRPAGGVNCPSCRHAPHKPQQPIIPVGNGRLAVLACATHQPDLFSRFCRGLQLRQHLTAPLDGDSIDRY